MVQQTLIVYLERTYKHEFELFITKTLFKTQTPHTTKHTCNDGFDAAPELNS